MKPRYEVFCHDTQRIIATFHYGIRDDHKAFFEAQGYMVRVHEVDARFHGIKDRDK